MCVCVCVCVCVSVCVCVCVISYFHNGKIIEPTGLFKLARETQKLLSFLINNPDLAIN